MTIPASRRGAAAFTLFELLLVIVVLSILLIVTAPALFNNSLSSQLTSAGDLVLNKLSEAQQEAIASNTEVEVRFIEKAGSGSVDPTPRLSAFQLLTLAAEENTGQPDNGFLPATSRTPFAEGIIISGKEKLSSLVKAGFRAGGNEDSSGPVRHLSLRFRPDGSTNLNAGTAWYLTLVTEDSERLEDTPANFYTIQIDPVTGRVRSFRP